MTNKITLEDIRNAMEIVRKNSPPSRTIEFDWGWLEIGYFGEPISVKLKRDQIKAIKDLCNEDFNFGKGRCVKPKQKPRKLKRIYGMKVLNSINLDK